MKPNQTTVGVDHCPDALLGGSGDAVLHVTICTGDELPILILQHHELVLLSEQEQQVGGCRGRAKELEGGNATVHWDIQNTLMMIVLVMMGDDVLV